MKEKEELYGPGYNSMPLPLCLHKVFCNINLSIPPENNNNNNLENYLDNYYSKCVSYIRITYKFFAPSFNTPFKNDQMFG